MSGAAGYVSRPTEPFPYTPISSRVRRGAGGLALFAAAAVIVGWATDNEFLKGAGSPLTMKPNAAVGLIACSVGLLARGPAMRPLRIVAATLAALIGALTLSQHVIGWNLGIDELLFREAPGAFATTSPARMGPNASSSLTLAGTALLLLELRSQAAATAAQMLALLVIALASLALVGYIYGARQLYAATRYTAIAWPTALALLGIGLGLLSVRPAAPPVSALVSRGPGGIVARRMLLPALLLPVLLGYLRNLGEEVALYDAGLGTALLAIALCVIFATAIWATALRLDEADRERQIAQRERDQLLVRERAAREDAERASRLKDDFLATLSHELRTPLNAVVGWTEMMRTQVLRDEQRTHAMDLVARNGQLLVRLVEDLLDISRIVRGRLHLERTTTDMDAVVRRVTDGVAAQAGAAGVTLRLEAANAPVTVLGDPERLEQVVGNLLANALKFTGPGGSIDIAVRESEGFAVISVRDNGRGIAPEFLPYVFERFRQQDATSTREHGGLGLGLAIVHDLTKLHGGSVSAHSDGEGRGSTFTVRLPAAGAPPTASEP